MKVELHDGLCNPLALQATRVLITSEDGTPLVLVVERMLGTDGKSQYGVFRAGDPDFDQQLRYNGITKTVLVTRMDSGHPTPSPFRK